PRRNHAATTPDLSDVGQTKLVLIQFGLPQRRGLCVGLKLCFADIGVLEDVQTLRVSRHDAILDSVVDHLDEVAGATGSAMQIALLRRAASLLATRCAGCRSDPGGDRSENRIEMLNDILFTADHKTVPTLRSPHSATGSGVDIVNAFGPQFIGSPDVVNVVRVAAVDNDVSFLQASSKVVEGLIDGRGRDHQPDSARWLQLGNEVIERLGSDRAILR